MKFCFVSILIIMFFSSGLNAQSLSGEYFLSTTNGEVVINLQVDGANQVGGFLKDDDGTQYQVQGSMYGDNANGTLTNAQGGMYFTATRQGNELNLTIIPPDANQQPNYNQAQAFAMTARSASTGMNTAPNTGGMGGPLGGGNNQAQDGWSGSYGGDIAGTASRLTLAQTGSQLTGEINADGYIYTLSGTVNGTQSQGRVVDSRTQGIMSYQASLSGKTINLNLDANGSKLQLQFTKGASSGSTASRPQPNRQQGGSRPKVDPSKLDQNVVGHWLYTESHTDVSAGFSMVTQLRLIVKADGTYLYGDAKLAGGDYNSSFSSGDGSEMSPGNWKTENGIISVNEGDGWYQYAKYYVEGNSMLLTFGDGSKQLWKR